MKRLWSGERRRDGGSVALEMAIVVPVVLAAIFMAIQVALYSFARSIALNAAQEGANAQRVYGADPNAGKNAAQAFLNRMNDSIVGTNVDVNDDGENVTVVVTGRSLSVIPGFNGFAIRQQATRPDERFTQ